MTEDEIKQRVIKAIVEFYDASFQRQANETALDAIARLSGVHKGHVRTVLDGFGVRVLSREQVEMTKTKLQVIEAHAELPVTAPAAKASQTFNVNAGHGSQVQVGHSVSGSQSMVTYQQVIEGLKEQIQKSSMPPEHKKSAIEKLGEFIASPGVSELLILAANHLPKL